MSNQSIVNSWTTGIESSLVQEYVNQGRSASGEWAQVLDSETEITDSNINIKFTGADYTYWMENGRQPNEDQDKSAIMKWVGWAGSTFVAKWCQDKGISVSAAYAIAYSIATKGYNGKPLVSKVINQESINELLRELSNSRIESIKSDVLNNLQNASN